MRESKIGMIQSPLQADLDRIADGVVNYLDADMALLSVTHNAAIISLGLSATVKRVRAERTHVPDDMVCLQVIQQDASLVLRDARDVPEFAGTGYVKAGLVAGYIGVPIQNAEIGTIGALCGVTQTPRDWSDADLQYLQAISQTVESLILREMYRLESLDATTLASEYDQIIAAFALVRADATSIHDAKGRLVFSNRALTEQIDETELESTRFKNALLRAEDGQLIPYTSNSGKSFVLIRVRTGSGYFVSQWKPSKVRLN